MSAAPRRAALLMGAVLGVGHAFVPSSPNRRAVSVPAGAHGGVAPSVEARMGASQQQGHGQTAAAGAAAALFAAVAWRAQRPAKGARKAPQARVAVEAKSSGAFAGATVTPVSQPALAGETHESLVVRHSLKSCHKLYFHRPIAYKDRAKRNIRNRAYNIFHKNQYKRDMRRALKKVKEIQYGEKQPANLEEVMTELKPYLDNACLSIDEVCIQGILHRNTAARRKDRICRAVLRGCVAMGVAEKPADPFVPAFEVIGYEMPKSFKTREPRPWQLPGWKSPWMLKKEYDKWKKQREAKKAAAAA